MDIPSKLRIYSLDGLKGGYGHTRRYTKYLLYDPTLYIDIYIDWISAAVILKGIGPNDSTHTFQMKQTHHLVFCGPGVTTFPYFSQR